MKTTSKHPTALSLFQLLLAFTPIITAQAQNSWTNRYHGFGYGWDWINAIAVDANGNSIVTGASAGPNTYGDFLTIKYSAAGIPLWTNRYHGPAPLYEEEAKGLVVDHSGNVFVTGSSYATNGYADYVTIKYSAAGVPLWTNRYNGPLNRDDEAVAIAVDANDDLIVTGYSTGLGTSADYATLKYSNAGVPIWTNRLNGPDNTYEAPVALALDSNGNIVVTGGSHNVDYPYDFLTIKYTAAGAPVWTNQLYGGYNGIYRQAYAVATDPAGNVFVTGNDNGSFQTLAYSAAGAVMWTNRFRAPGNHNDSAYAIAVDRNGDIVVAGATDYNGTPDCVLLKYSNAGALLWTNYYGNAPYNGVDSPAALVLDASGNIYVAGYSRDYPTYIDYVTLKYSGAGVPLSTNRYNGTGNWEDRATAIALDATGNVFVAGYSQNKAGDYDYVTIKYAAPAAPPAPIPLTIKPTGQKIILTWTNAAFGLQSAPEITGPFTNISGATSPYTNSISGPRQFFRLKLK